MKNVHTLALALATILVAACCGSESNVVSRTEQQLRTIWSATNVTASERCLAVNACFTNGTPIHRVLGVIGKNYELHITTTATWPPETANSRTLVYRFGTNRVSIL